MMANFDPNHLPDTALIRLKHLLSSGLVPFSESTLRRRCAEGSFPKPIRVSSQISAWRLGDIKQWLSEQADGGER